VEIKLEQQVKGTRLLTGEESKMRRRIVNDLAMCATSLKYEEVFLPLLEPAQVYVDKAGPEVLNQMYTFKDKGDRDLCLRPEGTATCQLLANETFKFHKDVKLWYETRCWRYEQPQAGRYREFTQFGVEILNPRDPKAARETALALAVFMMGLFFQKDMYVITERVKRGLAYYVEDGFEISMPSLGAQKQVCGGGSYKEGVGFAIGVDRLALAMKNNLDAMDKSIM
jgi:histidyl-tRNA synthetase